MCQNGRGNTKWYIALLLVFSTRTFSSPVEVDGDCGIYDSTWTCPEEGQAITLSSTVQAFQCINPIEQTMELIELGKENINLTDSREAVLLIGTTGTGKTTLTYFVAGNNSQLVAYKAGTGTFLIMSCNGKVSGNSTIISETIFPELVIEENTGAAFYDNPGFSDTRSVCIEIANSFFMKEVVQSLDRVKLLLAISSFSVRPGYDRQGLVDMLLGVINFIPNIKKFDGAIGLIGTKLEIHSTEPNENSYINDAKKFLLQARAVLNETGQFKNLEDLEKAYFLIDTLTSSPSKIAFFKTPTSCGPLTELVDMQENRQNITNMVLSNMTFKASDPSDYGYSFSSDAILAIRNISDKNINDTKATLLELGAQIQVFIRTELNTIPHVLDKFSKLREYLGSTKELISELQPDLEGDGLRLQDFLQQILVNWEQIGADNVNIKVPINKFISHADFIEKVGYATPIMGVEWLKALTDLNIMCISLVSNSISDFISDLRSGLLNASQDLQGAMLDEFADLDDFVSKSNLWQVYMPIIIDWDIKIRPYLNEFGIRLQDFIVEIVGCWEALGARQKPHPLSKYIAHSDFIEDLGLGTPLKGDDWLQAHNNVKSNVLAAIEASIPLLKEEVQQNLVASGKALEQIIMTNSDALTDIVIKGDLLKNHYDIIGELDKNLRPQLVGAGLRIQNFISDTDNSWKELGNDNLNSVLKYVPHADFIEEMGLQKESINSFIKGSDWLLPQQGLQVMCFSLVNSSISDFTFSVRSSLDDAGSNLQESINDDVAKLTGFISKSELLQSDMTLITSLDKNLRQYLSGHGMRMQAFLNDVIECWEKLGAKEKPHPLSKYIRHADFIEELGLAALLQDIAWLKAHQNVNLGAIKTLTEIIPLLNEEVKLGLNVSGKAVEKIIKSNVSAIIDVIGKSDFLEAKVNVITELDTSLGPQLVEVVGVRIQSFITETKVYWDKLGMESFDSVLKYVSHADFIEELNVSQNITGPEWLEANLALKSSCLEEAKVLVETLYSRIQSYFSGVVINLKKKKSIEFDQIMDIIKRGFDIEAYSFNVSIEYKKLLGRLSGEGLKLSEFLLEIVDSWSTLDYTEPMEPVETFIRAAKFLEKEGVTGNITGSAWLEQIDELQKRCEDEQKWFNLVVNLWTSLSKAKYQTGTGGDLVRGWYERNIQVSRPNFRAFLVEFKTVDGFLNETEFNEIERVLDEVGPVPKLLELNIMLNLVLRPSIKCNVVQDKLYVTGSFLTTSQILSTPSCFTSTSITTVAVHAYHSFFIDENLTGGSLNPTNNLNLIAISPNWWIQAGKKINMDGAAGKEADNPGDAGKPGGTAGNIVAIYERFIDGTSFTATVNGGKGGNGRAGSAGQAGYAGSRKTLSRESGDEDFVTKSDCAAKAGGDIEMKVKPYRCGHESSPGICYADGNGAQYWIYGTAGGNGSAGYDGGKSGLGGFGGTVYKAGVLTDGYTADNGTKGSDGTVGAGGSGGAGGRTGDTLHIYIDDVQRKGEKWCKVYGTSDDYQAVSEWAPSGPRGGAGASSSPREDPKDQKFLLSDITVYYFYMKNQVANRQRDSFLSPLIDSMIEKIEKNTIIDKYVMASLCTE